MDTIIFVLLVVSLLLVFALDIRQKAGRPITVKDKRARLRRSRR